MGWMAKGVQMLVNARVGEGVRELVSEKSEWMYGCGCPMSWERRKEILAM